MTENCVSAVELLNKNYVRGIVKKINLIKMMYITKPGARPIGLCFPNDFIADHLGDVSAQVVSTTKTSITFDLRDFLKKIAFKNKDVAKFLKQNLINRKQVIQFPISHCLPLIN